MSGMLVYNLPTLQLVCNLVYADNQNGSVVTQPPPTTPSPPLPNGYVAYPDFGAAYKFHNELVHWTEANSRCIREGARLAAIDSVEKIQVVRNQDPSRNLTHVGLNLMDDESTWYSVNTGLTVTTLPWASGEPNGSGRCAVIKRGEIGLGKYSCTGTAGDYVCQIPYPPKDRLIGMIAN